MIQNTTTNLCFFCASSQLHRLVAESSYGDNFKVRALPKPLAQTVNMDHYRMLVGFRIHPPNFIHELLFGKDFVRIGD
ncbi:hypothetical protein D3C75_1299980 [compost metagenome]